MDKGFAAKETFFLNQGKNSLPVKNLVKISKEVNLLIFVYKNPKCQSTYSMKNVAYDNNDDRNRDFHNLINYFQPKICDENTIILGEYLLNLLEEHESLNQNPGKKLDDGKLRWDLLSWEAVEKIVEVYTFGTKKYGENTWQNVENFEARYRAALVRHLVSHIKGEKVDEESQILHLAHMAWNALALIWFELQKEESDE